MKTTTAFDVTMPQLGETVSEGTVIDWLVEIGATIAAGDALLEVSTDKVDTELPSPVAGVVTEIIAVAGETVAVGAVIGRIAVEGAPTAEVSLPVSASVSATAEPSVPVAPAGMPTASPASLQHSTSLAGVSVATAAGARLRVSPVARRLAVDRKIDLASVAGTGPGGAIVKRDIELTPADRAAPARVPFAVGSHHARPLEATFQVGLDAVDRSGATHTLATYVIRAIVDSVRSASRLHEDLRPLVEPSVTYIHAPSGRTVAVPAAAGLRLSGLTTRLETAAAPTGGTLEDEVVTVLDCTDLECSISGVMAGLVSVSIGPRETVPALSAENGRVSITFRDECRLSIGVDGSAISVQALSSLAEGVKQVVESRNWTTEL